MKIITSLSEIHNSGTLCSLALGTFDGLHKGHLDVINTAKVQAQTNDSLLGVFTFSSHPLSLIDPKHLPTSLLTAERKRECLQELGVDIMLDIPFTDALAKLTPEEFMDSLCLMGISSVTVGENFSYGVGGSGNISTLETAAIKYGFKLLVRPLCSSGGKIISSTEIRNAVLAGDVVSAAEMLGRNYGIEGIVVHGDKRGRTLGFPTANIDLENIFVTVPAGGVYAVYIQIGDNIYFGMANIGSNPTFGDVKKPRLEVNIFDYNKDIYGEKVVVFFVSRIRGEQKFASFTDLQNALSKDEKACREILATSAAKISL